MVLASFEQLVVAAVASTSPVVAAPPLIEVVVCLSLATLVAKVMQALFGTLASEIVKVIPLLTTVTPSYS